ncbi:MAG: alpha/beta hydrolase-fold protein [Deltaproteobacteria bacterium]|nr:alpha/beta hydrolase-fold protein [Deltaproteobacteria bacterium]
MVRLIARCCAISLLAAPNALAICRVLPGPEGEVSTWLVTAPFATPNTRPSRTVDSQLSTSIREVDPSTLAPTASQSSGRTRWIAQCTESARFELSPSQGPRGSRTVFAGATLENPSTQPISIWIFAGADDGLTLSVDGHELARRASVRSVRDDDDMWPVTLTPGPHRLVLRSYVHGGAQRMAVRVVGDDFRPTRSVRITLDGVSDSQCNELAQRAESLRLSRVPNGNQTLITATLSYPGGTASVGETARTLVLSSGVATERGEIAMSGSFAGGLSLTLNVPQDAGQANASTGLASQRTLSLAVADSVREALSRAQILDNLSESQPPSWLPRGSLTSLRYARQRLIELTRSNDRDTLFLQQESTLLLSMLTAIAAQRDPYQGRTGALRRAYRSAVDGSLQHYSLYIPTSYRVGTRTPMVVALHGLGGSAHRMLPILFGLYDKNEDRTHADRHPPQLPDCPALILAPYGHGDSGYRGVGEYDVLQAMDEVRAAYAVDDDRTYMTGLSMGGIGAASIPLHFPSRFAASAALCGYHDYFVRTDTQVARRPWETLLMEARSNRVWADNALHLPFYVVQGTRDRPVTHSTTFVERLRALHYNVSFEYPDLGHDVWSTTYAGGRIFTHFLQYRRDPWPRRVLFKTVSLRWRTSHWVTVDQLDNAGQWATVDARVERNEIVVSTARVTALTLTVQAPLVRVPFTIRVDQQAAINVTQEGAIHLVRQENRWSIADQAPNVPVLGPIRDTFDGPIVVVYGTQVPAETALNRRIAEAWATVRGVHMNVSVIADDTYTPSLGNDRTVVVVGTALSNRVLARLQSSLAIRVSSDEVRVGSRTLTAPSASAVFVAPNTESTHSRFVVVTGATPRAVWRSLALPDLLPDYVVFGDRVAAARGRVLLGRYASVLCAGFYDANGQPGASCDDPLTSNATGDD